MTTVHQLIETCRQRYILAGHREERNRLATPVSDSDPVLSMTYALGSITRGSVISVGLEDCYVWSVNGATAEVDRGTFGSVAAAHDQGDTALVNARPTPQAVLAAINEVVIELSNMGLYQERHTDIVIDGAAVPYDLATIGYMAPIEVRVEVDRTTDDWPLIFGWEVVGAAPTTQFASGRALRVFDSIPSGRTVRFRYQAELTAGLTGLDDDVETITGIPPWAVDVLPLGAAVLLTGGREIARSDDTSQGDTRRAEEVPPNANLLAVRGVLALYEQRIAAIRRRLNKTNPQRMRAVR